MGMAMRSNHSPGSGSMRLVAAWSGGWSTLLMGGCSGRYDIRVTTPTGCGFCHCRRSGGWSGGTRITGAALM